MIANSSQELATLYPTLTIDKYILSKQYDQNQNYIYHVLYDYM